ncbi:TadE/TadG family type IV pilus assembly protein [Sphingomonas sp. PP-CE-1G-424]|uniref:TadE/TadG family type IV pilus assembly protein n=1 Tax=Sphingomonas sp. PP-CE-1G-424 TaxID=2135658 RepID=UPI0010544E81|nr:TadE/TadG family type IV pilus assembly protein [Sphingomonas sp. PP-CE-1G-424]TCP67823.1 Flp pilus assembly protein TadG [Sphingomonas sp. PP-CE-1G-424]
MNAKHGQKLQRPTTFLGRLRKDVAGNTLIIVAFAMMPLIAMVGSGLDMARAYVARDRLQQACDAGSLAARRLLSGTTLTTAVDTEAKTYFNFNFPQASFGTAAFTPVVTVPAIGTVKITAATTIPTTIMKLFGFSTMNLSTSCSATQDFVGTDIVLVLDMSGSMNCPPSKPNDACNEVEESGSKMQALRDASESLYDTLKSAQDQLHANNLRLRYGFVPYNATVNVGKLVYAENPNYIRSSALYQSRTVTTGWFGASATYGQQTLDTSSFKTGALVTTPGSYPSSKSRWAGCIEERQTDNVTIDGGSATTAPASAWDLDVNMLPTADSSRWAPWWPEAEFDPDTQRQYTDQKYCASAASRLKEYYNDKTSFMSYIKDLKPLGGTYHDIGVIWGARFISPDGIFASANPETNDQNDPDNPKKLRGFSVRKYMIFMTDGDMSPYLDVYTTYGAEERDRRVLGTSTGNTNQLAAEQLQRHLQRFRMACNAAKSQNVQLYVIAFSTTLTTDMQNCATTPAMASGISTAPALIAKFQEIGSKIGSLRINQ